MNDEYEREKSQRERMTLSALQADKPGAAQRLADALEKVRLLQDRIRKDQYELAQAEAQRDQALREFADAHRPR